MTLMAPCSTTQRIQWYRTSMCLVRTWYWWSRVSAMAAWLSEKRVVGSWSVPKTSEMRERSHSASLPPCVAATYSLSVVESETISCRLDDHETAPPSTRNA